MGDRDDVYFDDWHERVASGAVEVDELWSRALGLPAGLVSNSLLPGSGLDEIDQWLEMTPQDVLLDLACGRGAFGLELARRSGCRLLGVDFAASAVELARAAAGTAGLRDRAAFRVADMAATGLQNGSVSALLCVDAAQFGEPPAHVFAEALRLLRPGGRAVFTTWEARDPADVGVPQRLREMALADGLAAAGFVDVEARDREDWLATERHAWATIMALEPTGDSHLASLQEEGRQVQARGDVLRRVVATARRAR